MVTFLFLGTSQGLEKEVGLISGILNVKKWASWSRGSEERMKLQDPWLSGPAGGVSCAQQRVQVEEGFGREFEDGVREAKISFDQNAPWTPNERIGLVVFNEKKCPIWFLQFAREGGNVVVVKQIIQIQGTDNQARFGFGNENLVYLEVESERLLKTLRKVYFSIK